MKKMDALECIKTRRSIRKFKNMKVSKDIIEDILECGRWTPSGLNHQPWKIIVISNPELKSKLSQCTHYSEIIQNAPHLLVIYLDQTKKYSYVKDIQGIGALFQNLLLSIHAHELGGVWLGEIYNHKEEVNKIFEMDTETTEFMGVIAFGYPAEEGKSSRKDFETFVSWK